MLHTNSPKLIDLIVHELSNVPRQVIVSVDQRHLFEKCHCRLESFVIWWTCETTNARWECCHFSQWNPLSPDVTFNASGTATLAAPAIKRIDVTKSHCRDGRSHSIVVRVKERRVIKMIAKVFSWQNYCCAGAKLSAWKYHRQRPEGKHQSLMTTTTANF